jgi:acetoin utilization protein AcuB
MNQLTVRSYMTPHPRTIGRDQPLSVAHRMMRENHIRHLPVLSQSRLVGIVTDRDLRLIETLADVDPEEVKVEEAMADEPFTIRSDAPLEEVALEMARHKYGSAVVVDDGEVVGVFTTIDALRALQDLLARVRRRRPARPRRAPAPDPEC